MNHVDVEHAGPFEKKDIALQARENIRVDTGWDVERVTLQGVMDGNVKSHTLGDDTRPSDCNAGSDQHEIKLAGTTATNIVEGNEFVNGHMRNVNLTAQQRTSGLTKNHTVDGTCVELDNANVDGTQNAVTQTHNSFDMLDGLDEIWADVLEIPRVQKGFFYRSRRGESRLQGQTRLSRSGVGF